MNLLDLAVRVTCDDQASQQIEGVSNNIKGKLGGAVGLAGKAVAAGVAAAGAGVVALGQSALSGYASFEQLEGGIDKLFGTGGKNLEEYAASMGMSVEQAAGKFGALNEAHDLVMKNAQAAYATAGMSANEYMENVSGFAAALTSSLGGDTVEAAKQADVAMRAISDNVNTFGSDIDSVTMAFQGFAKQNYTMLDNLKLGYGGTKTEMERLIADANEWGAANGRASDLSIDSFSDVVTAIQYIQEKQQIAGTTAREASQTIEGSINATKAAWTNLLTELGKDDGDIGARINELAESAGNVVDNVIPRVEQIATGLSEALPMLVPKVLELGGSIILSVGQGIATALPALVTSLADSIGTLVSSIMERREEFMAAGMEMLNSIMAGLMPEEGFGERIGGFFAGIGAAFQEFMPTFLETVGMLLTQLWTYIGEQLPVLIENLVAFLQTIGTTIIENLPLLIEVLTTIATTVLETLMGMAPQLIETLVQLVSGLVTTLADNAPMIFEAAKGFFTRILDALVENLPNIIQSLVHGVLSLIDTIIQNGPTMLVEAAKFFLSILTALIEHLPEILAALIEGVVSLIQGVVERVPDMLQAGAELIGGLLQAIADALPDILSGIGELVMGGIQAIPGFIGDMLQAGKDLVQGLIDGLLASAGTVGDTLLGIAQGAVDNFLSFFGIQSPSKLMKKFGGFTMEGFAIGIEANAEDAEKAMQEAANAVYGAASGTVDVGLGYTQTTPQNGYPGVLITGNEFVVRSDEDIPRIAEAISTLWQREMDGQVA